MAKVTGLISCCRVSVTGCFEASCLCLHLMTATMTTSAHGGLPPVSLLNLLPLLPVRRPCVTGASRSVVDAVMPSDSVEAAEVHLSQLVDAAATALLDDHLSEAVSWLQSLHSKRNQLEAESGGVSPLKPEHWITMSACATAAGDNDTAASFAIQAWESSSRQWGVDLTRDFRDSRADATALLALSRLQQRRPDRAVRLLRCAVDEHRLVGDMEQLTADHLLLFLCHDVAGHAERAAKSLERAAVLVRESLDPARHDRRPILERWMRRYGHPRPALLKSQ